MFLSYDKKHECFLNLKPLVLRCVGRFPRGRGKPAPIANAHGCAVLPITLLPQESPTLLRTNSVSY